MYCLVNSPPWQGGKGHSVLFLSSCSGTGCLCSVWPKEQHSAVNTCCSGGGEQAGGVSILPLQYTRYLLCVPQDDQEERGALSSAVWPMFCGSNKHKAQPYFHNPIEKFKKNRILFRKWFQGKVWRWRLLSLRLLWTFKCRGVRTVHHKRHMIWKGRDRLRPFHITIGNLKNF